MWRWMVLLAGCNAVYGLDDNTKVRDAFVLLDEDGDTIVDVDDNCPKEPNADQSNADGDQLGDLCDNCPVVDGANTEDSDGDRIGDICDPHPTVGDCLLVVDNFRSKDAFAANWSSVMSMATVMPEDGHVVVRPGTSGSAVVTTIATSGVTDVIVRGRTVGMATVSAISSTPDDKQLYGCRLIAPSSFVADGPGIGVTVLETLVPDQAVGRNFVIRLTTDNTGSANDPMRVRCRIDYGVSVGTTERGNLEVLDGRAGFVVAGGEAVVEAISFTRLASGTCTATLYR